jgi:hypothetical protein
LVLEEVCGFPGATWKTEMVAQSYAINSFVMGIFSVWKVILSSPKGQTEGF